MNRLALLRPFALAGLLAASVAVHAQDPAVPSTPHTGDAWVDGRLADIATYATTYRDAFVDEVVRYRRAPRELVVELLARPGWTPGDVYFACSLAMQSGRPCRSVADARGGAARDWSALATEFGLAPGSPGFHALKRGIMGSYERWARPVAVDADLAPEFPGRPRAATAAPAAEHPAPSSRPAPKSAPRHPRES
ncbi:hypothetical protein [Lysobacter xanthus]